MRSIPSDPRGGFRVPGPPYHSFNGGFHFFNGGHNAGYWLGFALTILGFVILIAAGITLYARMAAWLGSVAGIGGTAAGQGGGATGEGVGRTGPVGGDATGGTAAGATVRPTAAHEDELAAELAGVRADHERSLSELAAAIRGGVHRVREDLQTTIAIAVLSGVLLLVGFVLLTVYA